MDTNPYRDFTAVRPQAPQTADVETQTQATQQPAAVAAECGSGWYHDEAIKQAQQTPARHH